MNDFGMSSDCATRAQIDAMINLPATPGHIKSILKVVRDYGVVYIALLQNGDALPSEKLNNPVPSVTVIGDDTDKALGPEGFDALTLRVCAMRASSIAIISSETVPNIYTLFSLMSGLLRAHTLIIETRPEQERAWIDYVQAISSDVPVILSTAMPQGWEQKTA
ncbi:MAG: hypothetical protein AB7Q04_12710 [Steroidobacteraceae bacterium]